VRNALGNRDIAVHPDDHTITCGCKAKGSTNPKRPNPTNSRQRPKRLRGGGLSDALERKKLQMIALNQEDRDNVGPQLFEFVTNEETVNKKVENQRISEGIALSCPETEPLMISILGAYLDCAQMPRINGSKRKAQQREVHLGKQKPPARILHVNNTQYMTFGSPPLIIPTCCGELTSYRFLGYTGAGYSCGWCLPLANERAAFWVENICEICDHILMNKPVTATCPVAGCITTPTIKCPHGVFPLVLFDDLYFMCIRKVYICDGCYGQFLTYEKCNFFYTLSMLKHKSLNLVCSIISR
jgi:hypothetical protein